MKRQANILSSIIANFDTVEEVIETSANSSGSALAENEKLLDSIEGKVRQFKNATQTMWSDALDDDMIKGFVSFGTELVKIIDKIGLFRIAIMGLIVYLNSKYLKLDFTHPIKSFKKFFGKENILSIEDMEQNLKKLEASYEDAVAAWKLNPTDKTQKDVANAKKLLDEYEKELNSVKQAQIDFEKAQSDLVNAENALKNYTGNDQEELKKLQDGVNRAKQRVQELEVAQKQNAATGAIGWKKLKQGVKDFGKQVGSAIKQMLVMYAISLIIEGITKLFDKLITTAEESAEAFQELQNELQTTKNELSDLESRLDEVNEQLDEMYSRGSLSFTDKEQLSLLEAEREELERQIKLKEQLAQQQQQGVNSGAIEQATYYRSTGTKTGKTAGANIASKAGKGAAIGGAIGTTAAGTAIGSAILGAIKGGGTGAAAGGPWGAIIGVIAGLIIGAIAGAGVGAIQSAAEDTVGDSLDNMKEKYAELEKEYREKQVKYHDDPTKKNKKKFDKAQTALTDYRTEMAKYLSEMDAYYSSIDLSAETDPERIKQLRAEMQSFYDTQDKWLIETGEAGAKTNALDRLFGKNAEADLKYIKEQFIEALDAGEEVNLEDMFGSEEEFYAFRSRMNEMGIYIGDIEQYLKDFKKSSEQAFDTTDYYEVAKGIAGITDAIQSLKDAIEEINQNGFLSAKTLTELQTVFGEIDSLEDEWKNFVKVMMSTTSTVLEQNQATKRLIQGYFDDIFSNGAKDINQILSAASALERLGFDNSLDYILDVREEAGMNAIADTIVAKKNRKEELEDIKEKDRTEEQKEELKKLTKELSNITIDTPWIKTLIEDYDLANNKVSQHIKLIEELANAQDDLDEAQEEQNAYESWFPKAKEVIDILNDNKAEFQNELKDVFESDKAYADYFSDVDLDFNPDDYEIFGDGWRNKYTYESLDQDEYIEKGNKLRDFEMFLNKHKDLRKKYDEYKAALTAYNELLWSDEGFKWLNPDGTFKANIPIELQTKIINLQNTINEFQNQIENELTSQMALELDFQVTLGKAGTVFDEYTSKMETLASIQSTIANGFTISAEKAREFAAVYPELLQEATVSANGQITLNSDVVNAVLEGERAKQNAAIDTQINALDLQIQEANSKIAFYQAQIKIAKEAAKIGTDVAWQEAQDKLTASNVLLGYLINNGVDEEIAYQQVAKNMSEDTTEFQGIVKAVSSDNFKNMSASAEGAANSMASNASAMQDSLIAITKQAHEAAKAVSGIANGEERGSTGKIDGISYGKSSNLPEFVNTVESFTGGETSEKTDTSTETPDLESLYQELVNPEAYDNAEDFIAALESNIDALEEFVGNAEGAKALLETLKKRSLSSFSPDTSSDLGASKDRNGNGVEDSKEFQEEMDYWEKRIAAEQDKYNQVQNEIDLIEAKGQRAGKEYYEEQIKLERERQSLLEQQKQKALEELRALEEAGQKGSDEWWTVATTLNDIEGQLDDVVANVWELCDAIAQVNKELSEETHNRFSDLTSDLESIRDILSSEDMFTDEGEFTEAGITTLGTYMQGIEIYKNGIAEVRNELAELGTWESFSQKHQKELSLVNSDIDISKKYEGNEDYFKDYGIASEEQYKSFVDFIQQGITSEQDFYDETRRLTDLHNQYVKGLADDKKAIKEMWEDQIDAVEDYTNTLVDNYNDYIDTVKEALDAERDLYNFKKSTSEKTKNIAELERKISALSGSDNAADIAERRKLQAELTDAKSDLDDHYYQYSKDAQSQALDEEATAYEESMTNYVETLRITLDEATVDLDTFLESVKTLVVLNADTIRTKYDETGLAISEDLTSPWGEAIEAMTGENGYEGKASDLINGWLSDEGFFEKFRAGATNDLTSPWGAGTNAVNAFDSDVKEAMENIKQNVESNVNTASGKLSKLYEQIKTTADKVKDIIPEEEPEEEPEEDPVGKPEQIPIQSTSPTKYRVIAAVSTQYGKLINEVAGPISEGENKLKNMAKTGLATIFHKTYKNKGGYSDEKISNLWRSFESRVQYDVSKFAKGTMGTKRDEWAITDEPWLGDELTMYATPQGTLSYMRAGSTVVPADITANLVEWGKLNPDMMSVGNGIANLNMISNAVNKPEFNLSFDALVKAEKITEDTLPELKRFVSQEINNLVKQMNYAIKGYAR